MGFSPSRFVGRRAKAHPTTCQSYFFALPNSRGDSVQLPRRESRSFAGRAPQTDGEIATINDTSLRRTPQAGRDGTRPFMAVFPGGHLGSQGQSPRALTSSAQQFLRGSAAQLAGRHELPDLLGCRIGGHEAVDQRVQFLIAELAVDRQHGERSLRGLQQIAARFLDGRILDRCPCACQ